ncbi:MAG: hypothetical protein WCI63_00575 [bacterium]
MDDLEENSNNNDKIWKIITGLVAVLFVASVVFTIIFGVRVKNNNKVKDKEIQDNLVVQEKVLRNEFQQEKEQDDIQYTTSDYFGNLKFNFPKVWATNIVINEGGGEEFIFMTDPNLIVIDKKTPYTPTALKVVVYKNRYEEVLKDWESKNKGFKPPYKLKEEDTVVSEIQGKKFSGLYKETKNLYTMTIIPYRDKTLLISTDGTQTEDTYKRQYEKILSSFELRK